MTYLILGRKQFFRGFSIIVNNLYLKYKNKREDIA